MKVQEEMVPVDIDICLLFGGEWIGRKGGVDGERGLPNIPHSKCISIVQVKLPSYVPSLPPLKTFRPFLRVFPLFLSFIYMLDLINNFQTMLLVINN